MTIRDIYKWAEENGVLDVEVELNEDCYGGDAPIPSFRKYMNEEDGETRVYL